MPISMNPDSGTRAFFYLPLFCYLLLLTGMVNRVTRLSVFFAGVSVLLLLVMFRSCAPINLFLFRHISWFRLFRNVVLLLPFFFSAVALLAAEQARLLLQRLPLSRAGRWRGLFWIIVVHAGLGVFLSRQEGVLVWSYLALLASGGVFAAGLFFPRLLDPRFLPLLLLIVTVAQAGPVFHGYASVVDERPVIRDAVRAGRARPVFAYLRPEQPPGSETRENLHLLYSRHRITMTDASFFDRQGFSTVWMYALQEKAAPSIFQRYFRNKLLVYDQVSPHAPEKDPAPEVLAAVLAGQSAALAAVPPGEQVPLVSVQADGHPVPLVTRVAGPADGVAVTDFGVNRLICETKFTRPVFLVYNDAYHPDWRVWVNGRPSRLFRANGAFKGVALPPGPNKILWAFCPRGGGWMYVLVLMINSGLLTAAGVLSWLERKGPPVMAGQGGAA